MKLKSLLRKAAIICCVLVALFGFQMGLQANSITASVAIASPFDNQRVANVMDAPNSRAAANKAKEDVKSAFDNVVGSGSANRVEGKAEKDYGKVQRSFGNTRGQAVGAAKQIQGNAKQVTGKAQNAVEDATESVQGAASDAVDAVKDFFNR